MFRSTYRQGDFAALCDLFRENSQEVQYARMARGIVPKASNHGRQDVLPCLHLNSKNREADAELNPDRLWAWRELLEQDQDLAAETREVAVRYLCRKIVRDLPQSVNITPPFLYERVSPIPFPSVLSRRRAALLLRSSFVG